MRPRAFTIAVLVGASVGLLFAGVSTYDFAQHVDRHLHHVHCSFTPGLGSAHAGVSGCQVALFSPYSSVFRSWIWGGIPVSLPAMAAFAFLIFLALDLGISRREDDRRAAGVLAVATAVPALASLVMGSLAAFELHALCKVCAGIYLSSAVCLVGGVGLWWQARRGTKAGTPRPHGKPETSARSRDDAADPAFVGGKASTTEVAEEPSDEEPPAEQPPGEQAAEEEPPDERQPEHEPPAPTATPAPVRTSWRYVAAVLGIGALFVAVPLAGYVAAMPNYSRFVGHCGSLADTSDPYGVLVPLDNHGGVPSIEVLDPMCPVCKDFEARLDASGLAGKLDRRALLFPLDNTCNWMVDDTMHPGACTVSYAVLCAGDRAGDVIAWAFDHQGAIRKAAAADPAAARRMVETRFPGLRRCIGSPKTRARLNKSLRWAVAHSLPVSTPQLYVDGVKFCKADTDLGLDFMLKRMLAAHAAGRLKREAATAPGAPASAGGASGGAVGAASAGSAAAKKPAASAGSAAAKKPAAPAGSAAAKNPAAKNPAAKNPAAPAGSAAAKKPAAKNPAAKKSETNSSGARKGAPASGAGKRPGHSKPGTDTPTQGSGAKDRAAPPASGASSADTGGGAS